MEVKEGSILSQNKEQTTARAKLIYSSRELFGTMPYDKVSIRMISKHAEVSNSLISYYFGNKEGLFETVIHETADPMYRQLMVLLENATYTSFIDLVEGWFDEVLKAPNIVQLFIRVISMPTSDSKKKLVQKILNNNKEIHDQIFNKLLESNVISPDADRQLCRITWTSLIMFPFIAPIEVWESLGLEKNEQTLKQILHHNLQVLEHGFLVDPDDRS